MYLDKTTYRLIAFTTFEQVYQMLVLNTRTIVLFIY